MFMWSRMANGKLQQTDQGSENAQMLTKDSIEFKLLLAYSVRNEPAHSHLHQSRGGEAKAASPESPEDHSKQEKRKKKMKKKKKKNKLLKVISCIRPAENDDIQVTGDHRRQVASYSEEQDLEGVVNKLIKIKDSVHFFPGEIESDGDDIIEKIVELLRDHGDKLNEEIEKNLPLMQQLQAILSYSFFENVAMTFMQRLSPAELPHSQSHEITQIALTCEVTRRLNTMDQHPMNRVLGFGAKYLQDYFTPWINSQGGYGEVLSSYNDAEEEIQ
ncbi:apoptosis facilitator Bcl-2-like protein 14 [Electrophorus electricus]|nr:apoptosis facilitator Bcl-2-like protein 14 [Electrophorus electricus]